MKTSMQLPAKIPVGVWIRVSTDDQARGESPQHHTERAKAYASLKGYDIREFYDLAGVSGKSVKEREREDRLACGDQFRNRQGEGADDQDPRALPCGCSQR